MIEREYRRKPQVVKAVQFDGTYEQARELVDRYVCISFGAGPTPEFHGKLLVDLLEGGWVTIEPGAWLVDDELGRVRPVSQADFEREYEPVPDAEADPASRLARVAAILGEHYPVQAPNETDAQYILRMTRHAETAPDRQLDERIEAAWKAVGGRE